MIGEPIGRGLRRRGVDDGELDDWLAQDYATAYRTACLVLHDPHEAQDAVQEAFLRVWRFRSSIPADDGRKAWLYRVVVNACTSRHRAMQSRTGKDVGPGALEGLPDLAPAPEQPLRRRSSPVMSSPRWPTCPSTCACRWCSASTPG